MIELFAALYIFYIFFLAVMSLYSGHKKKTLTLPSKILGYPILFVGACIDFSMNMTVFTILFLERPRHLLVTKRLISHINDDTWRGNLSRYICQNLLSPFDPEGKHCKDH